MVTAEVTERQAHRQRDKAVVADLLAARSVIVECFLILALEGERRLSWRKIKKRTQQVHPPFSSPDVLAAPVESVVESGQAVLVAHVLCVKYG